MYICPYVRKPRVGGNVIFLAPNWDIALIFFVHIPLTNEHLFCKYFVRWSAGLATKGRNVKNMNNILITQLFKVSWFLKYFMFFLYYHSFFSFATYGCCHPCFLYNKYSLNFSGFLVFQSYFNSNFKQTMHFTLSYNQTNKWRHSNSQNKFISYFTMQ